MHGLYQSKFHLHSRHPLGYTDGKDGITEDADDFPGKCTAIHRVQTSFTQAVDDPANNCACAIRCLRHSVGKLYDGQWTTVTVEVDDPNGPP